MKVKDELQTVPIHGNLIMNNINGSKLTSANTNNNNNNNTKSKNNKNNNNNNMGKIKYIESSTSEKLLNNNKPAVQQRRDTDNSTTSSTSNLDSTSFSPIDLENQEVLKIEKKRERNREAARKCRTRKLEKIAALEQEVQRLTESNEMERMKTSSLREEVNKIRKKLEEHQKMNQCDLKSTSGYF